jgi:DNA-binding NarL/FixJ family response regulator
MPQNPFTHWTEPSDAAPLRVLIVTDEDDHSRRIARQLEKAGFVLASRHSSDITAASELGPPSVAVLFVNSYGDASDRALASVESLFPPPQVILLCRDLRLLPPDYMLRVFAAVPREYDDTLLVVLVRTACNAGPRSATGRFCVRYRLSPRERGVIGLFCAGHANKEIADRLGLSERTVDEYWKRIFAKANCRSQREIVALLVGDNDAPKRPTPAPLGARASTIGSCQYFPGQRSSGQDPRAKDP